MTWKDDYSLKFDELRKHRVEQSYYKYGPAKKNFGEGLVDALGTTELCIEKYKKTGNTEYLCDAANYMMFEFMFPKVDGAYFVGTGSEDSAGTVGTPYNQLTEKQDRAFTRMVEAESLFRGGIPNGSRNKNET